MYWFSIIKIIFYLIEISFYLRKFFSKKKNEKIGAVKTNNVYVKYFTPILANLHK